MWDRNYSDENGNDHKDESKNIDTSHGKNSDSIMKSPLEEWPERLKNKVNA